MESKVNVWAPFKDLLRLAESVVLQKSHDQFPDFEAALKKHQASFCALLRNPAKDSSHRELLKKAVKEPVQLPGWQTSQTLPQSLVEEAFILADMYNLNEISALSLLALGEEQAPIYPGLKRGLIAVLLYYDSKYSQANALKIIYQARRGVQWTYQLTEDVLDSITRYSDKLLDSGLFDRMFAILSEFDVTKEMELLSVNQALGPPRHRRQLMDYIKNTRQAVADIIFSRCAQNGLPLAQTLRLIDYLSEIEVEKAGDPPLDFSNIVLLLSLLYAFDLSVLHRHEHGEELAKELPIFSDKNFVTEINRVLGKSGKTWKHPGFQSLARLAWATSLAALRSIPGDRSEERSRQEALEQDESFVDLALEDKAFAAVKDILSKYDQVYSEEFYIKRFHYLMSDLLVLMPLKIKDIRNKAEETARTLIVYQQEGLVPPAHLPQHFENLLEAIAAIYSQDPLNLNLCLEFWYSTDYHSPQRNTSRQMSLNKFVRLAGDLLPPSLYIPYIRMLGSLANSPRAAHYAFNLLKQNGVGQANTVSWDHFFSSLSRYLNNLRSENYPVQDTVYRQKQGLQGGITAQEMLGFQEILRLTRTVADLDDAARMALAENPSWTPLVTLLGLATCGVPVPLKADFLTTLAAFAKSRDIATALWHHLEMAQLIATVPSTSSFPQRGIHTDLEEVESRNEEYPLTGAFLKLLNALAKADIPLNVGVPNRAPGIDPYIKFVVDNVLLRSHTRAYRKSSEKWEICSLAMKLLHRLLFSYEPTVDDLQPRGSDLVPQQPGFGVLVSLLQDSPLLRMILFLLDESVRHFDEYTEFEGREACEKTALYCLNTFNRVIRLQETLLEMVRTEGSSLRVSSLGTLLLGVNQRTNRPDHMLNIAKFISYGSEYMPRHATAAAPILAFVAGMPSAQQHLLALFTGDPSEIVVRHGIVEALDDEFQDPKEGVKVKICLLRMLQQGINLPHPSLAHFLLGFSLQKPLHKTTIQNSGISGTPRDCLHSLVNILDEGLKGGADQSVLVEGYKLLHGILAHSGMSYPVLRYLKGNLKNFLARHGEAMPFAASPTAEQLSSMAYVLLCLAIDVRVSSLRGSNSQAQRLASILFSSEAGAEGGDTDTGLRRDITAGSSFLTRTFATTTGMGAAVRPRVLALLDCIDVSEISIATPELELFEIGQLQALLKECEMPSSDGGPSVINVRHLQRRVENELSALEGTTALAQRQAIMQEFKTILQFSVESNNAKQQIWSRRCFIDAWRQTLETILLSTTAFSNNVLVQVVQEVLRKSVQESASQELNQPLSGLLVIAVTSLRVQMMNKQETSANETFVSFLDRSGRTEALSGIGIPASAVRVIIKGVAEWILKTGPSAQRIRINLYTALVGCLRLSAAQPAREGRGLGGSLSASAQATGVETLLEYGDSFLSALCRDSASGHDIQRMLALSLLDTIIAQSPVGPVAGYAAKHGYIRHLLEILGSLDESLTMALERHPSALAMRSLQVYASVMSFLTRLAMTSRGSQLLLDSNVLKLLSDMGIFSLRPESSSQDEHAFITSPFHRFQEILFPALSLCQAMLAALGSEHRAIREQVLGLLLAHSETVGSILRGGQNFDDLHHLEEVALLTSVISKSSSIAIFSEVSSMSPEGNEEIRAQVNRLQNLCLGLLPLYTPTDAAVARLVRCPGVQEDANPHIARHKAIRLYLQVCLNLLNIALNMTSEGVTKAYSRLVFAPSFTAGDLNGSFAGSRSGQAARSVALGVVVNTILAVASKAKTTEIAKETLSKKLEAIENLPADELSQFVPKTVDDTSSVSERRESARQTLSSVIENQKNELTQCRLIMEVSLILLWKHLDGFMNMNGALNVSAFNLSFDATSKFKEDAAQFLDLNFFRQIEDISKVVSLGGVVQDFSVIVSRRIRKSFRV